MKDRHDQVTAALGDLVSDVIWTEYNPDEYKHPATQIGRIEEDDADQQIEVIYLPDVVLLQEQGADGKDRTGFVWVDGDWPSRVKAVVQEWLASV